MAPPSEVPSGLRLAAAYTWRFLVLAIAAYLILNILGRLEFVVIALFVGLIIAALVAPWVRVFDKYVPRWLAVTLGLFLLLLVIAGVLTFISSSVAGEWTTLAAQFRDGIAQLAQALEKSPLHVHDHDFIIWYDKGRQYLIDHRGDLAESVLGGAGTIFEGFAGFALAIFSAVFFLSGGDRIWAWAVALFPRRSQDRIDGAGSIAWRSFAGYTRGIIIVAAANATFVCILLLILRVPLAVPLAFLVFFGTFVPLIGAPLAMMVAAVVALAARGPIIALIVIAGIVLLGQLEGHVLQPLVMSRAVHIHPLAVAVSVAAGTLLAGLFGAVIAVPVVSVFYGIFKYWRATNPNGPPSSSAESDGRDIDPVTDPTTAHAAPAN